MGCPTNEYKVRRSSRGCVSRKEQPLVPVNLHSNALESCPNIDSILYFLPFPTGVSNHGWFKPDLHTQVLSNINCSLCSLTSRVYFVDNALLLASLQICLSEYWNSLINRLLGMRLVISAGKLLVGRMLQYNPGISTHICSVKLLVGTYRWHY